MKFSGKLAVLAFFLLISLFPHPLIALTFDFSALESIRSKIVDVREAFIEPKVELAQIDKILYPENEKVLYLSDLTAQIGQKAALVEETLVAATISLGSFFSDWRDKLFEPTLPPVNVSKPVTLPVERTVPTQPLLEKLLPAAESPLPAPAKVAASFAPAESSVLLRVGGLERQLTLLRELMTRQSDRSSQSVSKIVTEVTSGGSSAIDALSGVFGALSVSGGLSLGAGTTTASNGFDISGGCFSVGGVCLSGGGSSSSVSGTFPILVNSSVISLGFGTTTNNSWSGAQTFLSASTTLQSFTFTTATGTSATTTNLATTNFCLNGDCRSVFPAAATFAFPYKTLSTSQNSTSTTIVFGNGLVSSASSTLASTTVTSLLANNSTTTDLHVSGLASTTNLRANTGIIGFLTSVFNSVTNLLVTGSSTLQNATSSAFAVTSIAAGSLVKTAPGGGGALIAAAAATDFVAPATTITIAGTSNQVTSSAGAQDLSTNRTWTLSIPALFNIGRATTTEFSAGMAFFGRTATTTINGQGDLFVTGSTTLQAFTATSGTVTSFGFTSGTSTNLTTTNLMVFSSSTMNLFRATTATSSNLYATNFLALGSTTLQNATSSDFFISGLASSTNLRASVALFGLLNLPNTSGLLKATGGTGVVGNAVAGTDYLAPSTLFTFAKATTTEFSAGMAFFGRTATTTINGQGDLFVTGSTTLQAFTFSISTGTQASTTNLYSVSAQFGAAATDVVNFTAGNFNYLNRATTTLQVTNSSWVIATNTAAAAYPLMSFNNSAGTSTIQFFGATTTGLTAGTGLGIPTGQFVLIGDGKTPSGLNILKGSLCVDNDGWCTASTTGRISSISNYLGGADVAEMYQAAEALVPGDVVSIVSGISVEKAVAGVKERMMGVVSTNPGIVLGTGPDTDGRVGDVPVALAGRVPVKVSTENGTIRAGDYLTISSERGVGMKATKSGTTIGQALENYSGSGISKILVFVKNSYYSGLSLDNFPGLTVSGVSTPEALLMALKDGAHTTSAISSDLTVDRMLAAVEIITPKVYAGLVSAEVIESPTITALSNRITMEVSSLRSQIDAQNAAIVSLESRVAALENASSTNFLSLASVSEAVNGLFNSASEWVVGKITAALGVFTRLEVGTVRVSEGIEMVDPSDGLLYCVRINNQEWQKVLGSCDSRPAPAPDASAPEAAVPESDEITVDEEVIEEPENETLEVSEEEAIQEETPAGESSQETLTETGETSG